MSDIHSMRELEQAQSEIAELRDRFAAKMATPVGSKPTFADNDMYSRTGSNAYVDAVVVSAEAPAPDLVERLRAGYPCKEAAADGCCKVMDARSGCICAEAADELSRLTAEVARLSAENTRLGGWDVAYDDRIQLVKENERLRAELRTAADMIVVYEGRLQEKEAENERLRAALLPFASIQSQMGDYVGYPDNIIVRIEASVGELRRARAALRGPRT